MDRIASREEKTRLESEVPQRPWTDQDVSSKRVFARKGPACDGQQMQPCRSLPEETQGMKTPIGFDA